jgi:hypothetical protein
MFETILLEIQRLDMFWIVWWAILVGILILFIIREVNAWFWKINTLIDTQEAILSTLEDIRELLSSWVEEPVEEKKETVTEMLEKKPKKVKMEKDEEKNPPKE